jgi:hypothetical protein
LTQCPGHLRAYTPNADRLTSAMQLASDVAGLRPSPGVDDRGPLRVQAPDEGSEIRLRRIITPPDAR